MSTSPGTKSGSDTSADAVTAAAAKASMATAAQAPRDLVLRTRTTLPLVMQLPPRARRLALG